MKNPDPPELVLVSNTQPKRQRIDKRPGHQRAFDESGQSSKPRMAVSRSVGMPDQLPEPQYEIAGVEGIENHENPFSALFEDVGSLDEPPADGSTEVELVQHHKPPPLGPCDGLELPQEPPIDYPQSLHELDLEEGDPEYCMMFKGKKDT